VSKPQNRTPSGWDPLATWYDGWVGATGSEHHRRFAIPCLLRLMALQADEHVLDIGAGQGVLAPYVTATGARYTGVEISPRLLELARKRHRRHGRFIRGDARYLHRLPELRAASFDAVAFLFSIQDMNPLDAVLRSAAWALRDGGRLAILMTHPCFRVPRQSGWGHDPGRKLQFRRIDRYLNPLTAPMKTYGKGRKGVSITFHRPLSHYVNGLAACGLAVDALEEITTPEAGETRAEQRANAEIPLFIGLRARKIL